MYRAIGDESSWRDGVFSHAAPFQDYQASVSQFEEGSLGAYARPLNRSEMARNHVSRKRSAQPRHVAGLGQPGVAYRSGVFGDVVATPAATPPLVLPPPSTINLPAIPGSTANPSTITIGPGGLTVLPTPPPPVPLMQQPGVQLAVAGGLAVILYLCLRHKG